MDTHFDPAVGDDDLNTLRVIDLHTECGPDRLHDSITDKNTQRS